ncbi:hypothetical protein GCM10027568_19410 [Humibacter soli]
MTKDEQFIIENAEADDDLDVLLATHRCADCAEPAFLQVEDQDGRSVWLCVGCAEESERESAFFVVRHAA